LKFAGFKLASSNSSWKTKLCSILAPPLLAQNPSAPHVAATLRLSHCASLLQRSQLLELDDCGSPGSPQPTTASAKNARESGNRRVFMSRIESEYSMI